MAKEGSFGVLVEELKAVLTTFVDERKKNGLGTDEWLLNLYSAYSDQMRSDNQRIWSTGSIFLPLSLACFAAFVSIEAPQFWHAIVLGIASSALVWCWQFIAENHRAFQQKSEAWIVAIQEVEGIVDKHGPKSRGNRLNQALTSKGAVQKIRWWLACGIPIGWAILAALFKSGRLP